MLFRSATQTLGATGSANPSNGFNSNALDLVASSKQSGQGAQDQRFRWVTTPQNNETGTPLGRLDLQFGNGQIGLATVLSINANGTVNFPAGATQLFTNVDVNGLLQGKGNLRLPATGPANTSVGFNSNALDLMASSKNSSGGPEDQQFRWVTTPVNNQSANPDRKSVV